MDNGLEVVDNSAWVIIVRELARESVSFSRRLGADFENLSASGALIYHSDRESGA